MYKKIFSIMALVAVVFSYYNLPQATATEKSTLEIEAFDTIAGYTTVAAIEDGLTNKGVEIMIIKPNGSEILLEAETDEDGEVKAEIDGYHLKTAGSYEIKAKYTHIEQEYGQTDSFKVYEDGVSLNKSSLSADSVTTEASGYDPVELTVKLKDRYGNPITGHSINIISSRSSDEITAYSSDRTNEKGEAIFYAYSDEVGVSTYTAYDSTSNATLDQRAKVAYFSPVSTLGEIGGNNLFTSVLLASTDTGTSGEMDRFEIEELSSEVEVNELLNFTVTAYDINDEIVEDYTGTVRFSSSDDNADMPEDYTFEAEDQGSHTFSLSLRFTTTGTQTVTVTDTDDRDLEGEIEVAVVASGSGSSQSNPTSSTSTDSDVTITSPTSGTYSSESITISGKTPYGYYVDVYANSSRKTSVFTEADDTYSADIELSNGTYEVYVTARDAEDNQYATSESVSITIDTEAATLDYIEISPEGDLEAGSTFEVYAYSEPNLHQVGILLDDKIYELTESLGTNGTYVGLLVAPDEAGTYALDVILVDSLANEIQYSDAATLTVVSTATEEVTTPEEPVVEEPPVEEPVVEEPVVEEIKYPSTVTGLEAVNGDTKVTLTWEAAIAGSEDAYIDHYKVYYGYADNLLYSSATTFDSSTTWYVPNLANDTVYYFAVSAVDSKGVESLAKSTATSGTPVAAEVVYTIELGKLHDSADEQVSIEDTGTPDQTPQSGPGTAWVLLFTLAFTQIYFQAKKKIAEKTSV